jgi:hypothetical protein
MRAGKEEGTMTFGYYKEPTGYYLYNAGNLPDRFLLHAAELIYYENTDIPQFRRESEDGAFAEGWAEYAASLAGEMGMYSDPYDLYGRLSGGEMFLSARLVVDTGMNALLASGSLPPDDPRASHRLVHPERKGKEIRNCP